MSKQSIVMDATYLTGLMNCARQVDFRHNMNLVSIKGKSNSLECGSIVHTYLESFYKNLIKGVSKPQAHEFGMVSAEMYIRGCPLCTGFTPSHSCTGDVEMLITDHICDENCILKPSCGHQVDQFPGVSQTEPESEGYKIGWKWVLITCEQYYDHYKNDYWVPLEIEVVKAKVIYEDDVLRVLWKAKLDMVSDTNQGIYPVDHKTMKQNRDNTKLNNQFKGQCVLMDTRNVIINKIGFQKTLKPIDKFSREMISYSADALYEWASEIVPYYAHKVVEFNETGYWAPNYSNCDSKYGRCPFTEVCESDRGMREEVLKNNFITTAPWNPQNEVED